MFRKDPLRPLLVFILLGLSASLISASEIVSDFSDGFGLWQRSPSGTWEIRSEAGNTIAALVEAGVQSGGVRRPTGYLLLPGMEWTDAIINLRAKTLEPASLSARDVVVILGYVDATHFYYVHLSSDSDDAFHTIIMKVDGAERSAIDQQVSPVAPLTDDWHDIRVVHTAAGAIAVFVDDMETALMTAQDTDYPKGMVGIGSFDDRALFDDVRISGQLETRVTTRLLNISTRTGKENGQDVLIAGFVVSGQDPQRLLVRAAGPALVGFGVTGTLEDPVLNLYNSSAVLLAANDNWGDSSNVADIRTVSAQVGAFEFASGSADAAILITLDPGVYTAQVKGGNGVSLVEVYAVETPQ